MSMILGSPVRPVRVLSAVLLSVVFLVPSVAEAQRAPEHDGFTLLLNIGVGTQKDPALSESMTAGLAGINLGIGGFLNERAALWFRVSGTVASHDIGVGSVTQTSGFAGPALQYWTSERFAVEGGLGLGYWDVEGTNESGLGALLGASYVFWTNGGHSLSVGAEYAPAFTDPDTVHNFGVVFGWQKN